VSLYIEGEVRSSCSHLFDENQSPHTDGDQTFTSPPPDLLFFYDERYLVYGSVMNSPQFARSSRYPGARRPERFCPPWPFLVPFFADLPDISLSLIAVVLPPQLLALAPTNHLQLFRPVIKKQWLTVASRYAVTVLPSYRTILKRCHHRFLYPQRGPGFLQNSLFACLTAPSMSVPFLAFFSVSYKGSPRSSLCCSTEFAVFPSGFG